MRMQADGAPSSPPEEAETGHSDLWRQNSLNETILMGGGGRRAGVMRTMLFDRRSVELGHTGSELAALLLSVCLRLMRKYSLQR